MAEITSFIFSVGKVNRMACRRWTFNKQINAKEKRKCRNRNKSHNGSEHFVKFPFVRFIGQVHLTLGIGKAHFLRHSFDAQEKTKKGELGIILIFGQMTLVNVWRWRCNENKWNISPFLFLILVSLIFSLHFYLNDLEWKCSMFIIVSVCNQVLNIYYFEWYFIYFFSFVYLRW